MRTLLNLKLVLTAFALSAQADADQHERLVKTIYDRTQETTLQIEADTFIENIRGYACPLPAINFKRWHAYAKALEHNKYGDFRVKNWAMALKDPNERFCNFWPDAEQLFGSGFRVGADFKLSIRVQRVIYLRALDGNQTELILKETISTELNGVDLISEAEVSLGDPQDSMIEGGQL